MSGSWFEDLSRVESPFAVEAQTPEGWSSEEVDRLTSWPEYEEEDEDAGESETPFAEGLGEEWAEDGAAGSPYAGEAESDEETWRAGEQEDEGGDRTHWEAMAWSDGPSQPELYAGEGRDVEMFHTPGEVGNETEIEFFSGEGQDGSSGVGDGEAVMRSDVELQLWRMRQPGSAPAFMLLPATVKVDSTRVRLGGRSPLESALGMRQGRPRPIASPGERSLDAFVYRPEFEEPGGFEQALDGVEPALEQQVPRHTRTFGNVSVSTGQFGKVLRRFAKEHNVPDAVLLLLKQSKTFMSILKTLDSMYVDSAVQRAAKAPPGRLPAVRLPWAQRNDGVFTQGRFKGRRPIAIYPSPFGTGSSFVPYGTADATTGEDVILLDRPDPHGDPRHPTATNLDTQGRWLEAIAHESVHAYRHVLGKARAGKTEAERIRARIGDEIATRVLERKIVDEVRNGVSWFARYKSNPGSLKRWAVERDFFPSAQKRTYLEHFVLSERLDAASKELAEERRSALQDIVERISLGSPPFLNFLTINPQFVRTHKGTKRKQSLFQLMYPRILLARRVVDARWRSVKDLDQRDRTRDATLERMRQEHATAFFGGLVAYTPLPPPP